MEQEQEQKVRILIAILAHEVQAKNNLALQNNKEILPRVTNLHNNNSSLRPAVEKVLLIFITM